MLSNQEVGDSLRWKKFPVLDDGFVCLVDWMGDDSSVVQAARVSYGAGTKHVSDDRNLIRYLYRHAHTTPFEMNEVKFLIRMPMDAWRQHIRHRTASTNEYSTRYSEAIDSNQKTPVDKWRLQSGTNKQGSSGQVEEWPEGFNIPEYIDKGIASQLAGDNPGEYLSWRERSVHEHSREVYEERLKFGVAREQARKDLPLSTYTEAYWKCDLKNLFHFLSLRMDKHAQLEIRQYADIMGKEIVAKLFPECWGAFEDYDQRQGGLLLTASEIKLITQGAVGSFPMGEGQFGNFVAYVGWPSPEEKPNHRERNEALEKFKRLALIRP